MTPTLLLEYGWDRPTLGLVPLPGRLFAQEIQITNSLTYAKAHLLCDAFKLRLPYAFLILQTLALPFSPHTLNEIIIEDLTCIKYCTRD